MKKLLAFILSVVYITASSGVVLNVHYCMGKLSSVLLHDAETNVCKCGMKANKNDCCHSEVKVLKLNNVHKQSVANVLVQLPVVIVSKRFSLIDVSGASTADLQEPVANGPPIYSSSRIYLQNCVFRI